jgi:hypothetical protein
MVVPLENNSALPLSASNIMAMFGSGAGPVITGPNAAFSAQGSGPVYEANLLLAGAEVKDHSATLSILMRRSTLEQPRTVPLFDGF